MNPHPSHKIKIIKVAETSEIVYCEYCNIYTSHPEIEQPCKRRPDLLTELKRLESIQGISQDRLGED